MLCESKLTIYAMIDALVQETGDDVYLTVQRAFVHGMRAAPTLQFVAEVRSGDLRGRNYPLFAADGEECLRVVADNEEEALRKLAALCCLVPA